MSLHIVVAFPKAERRNISILIFDKSVWGVTNFIAVRNRTVGQIPRTLGWGRHCSALLEVVGSCPPPPDNQWTSRWCRMSQRVRTKLPKVENKKSLCVRLFKYSSLSSHKLCCEVSTKLPGPNLNTELPPHTDCTVHTFLWLGRRKRAGWWGRGAEYKVQS